MVDALAPAVRALEANGEQDVTVAMEAAAAAAAEGSEKTREYVAKFGRSRYVGERALGHLDAGSVSVSILFAAMKEYLNTCDQ
jgi:dihydroxyacetone kinase-like protein